MMALTALPLVGQAFFPAVVGILVFFILYLIKPDKRRSDAGPVPAEADYREISPCHTTPVVGNCPSPGVFETIRIETSSSSCSSCDEEPKDAKEHPRSSVKVKKVLRKGKTSLCPPKEKPLQEAHIIYKGPVNNVLRELESLFKDLHIRCSSLEWDVTSLKDVTANFRDTKLFLFLLEATAESVECLEKEVCKLQLDKTASFNYTVCFISNSITPSLEKISSQMERIEDTVGCSNWFPHHVLSEVGEGSRSAVHLQTTSLKQYTESLTRRIAKRKKCCGDCKKNKSSGTIDIEDLLVGLQC